MWDVLRGDDCAVARKAAHYKSRLGDGEDGTGASSINWVALAVTEVVISIPVPAGTKGKALQGGQPAPLPWGPLASKGVKKPFFWHQWPDLPLYSNWMFFTPKQAQAVLSLCPGPAAHSRLENLSPCISGRAEPMSPTLSCSPRLPHRGLIFVRVCFNTAYGLHYTQTSHFHNYTMTGVPVKAIKQILLPRPVPPPPLALPIKLTGVPVCEEKENPINPLLPPPSV